LIHTAPARKLKNQVPGHRTSSAPPANSSRCAPRWPSPRAA